MENTLTIGFFSTVFALIFVRPYIIRANLLDYPSERKLHKYITPVYGGISMGIGFFAGLVFINNETYPVYYLILSLFILIVVGVMDDKYSLSVKTRLLFQIISALIMTVFADVKILSLGAILPWFEIDLFYLSIPFTIMATVGVINSLNMIDGIDGLAGSVSLVVFLSVAYMANISGHDTIVNVALLFCAVVIPFLMFNLSLIPGFFRPIFMGDAGSMFLGLGIIWLLVQSSQGESRLFSPVTALWIFAVPLIDTVAIMIRRIKKGQSAFLPDRKHIHYIFTKAGLSDRQALLVIVLISLSASLIGIAGEVGGVSEWKMFALFIVFLILYIISIMHSWRVVKKINIFFN
jgi:UDP-GlcNAc:undecaprenyl-phosphate GlcNAc-1-phosphate transferase